MPIAPPELNIVVKVPESLGQTALTAAWYDGCRWGVLAGLLAAVVAYWIFRGRRE